MNARTRQYIFGAIFLGISVYYLVTGDWLEGTLYALAGTSFILNTLATEPSLVQYKKPLGIITWAFIIVTGILFLWVLQAKYF